MTTIHSTVEPRKHVRVTAIGDEDVALDVGRPGRPAVSLVAIRVPVAELRAALDEVAPAGSYTRTDEEVDPDGDDTRTREHLLAEEHRLLGLERSLRAHLSRTINRAEKAEQERDEAVTELQARIEFGIATEQALTADDVTDEMIQRAFRVWEPRAEIFAGPDDSVNGKLRAKMRRTIAAALTEPPARPEWADIEDVLNAGWPEGINGAENGYIARTLHEGGVRVTGAES